MTKSDLTRRANRAALAQKVTEGPPYFIGFGSGFEAGYLAARADLRKIVKAAGKYEMQFSARRLSSIVGSMWHWLKPIR